MGKLRPTRSTLPKVPPLVRAHTPAAASTRDDASPPGGPVTVATRRDGADAHPRATRLPAAHRRLYLSREGPRAQGRCVPLAPCCVPAHRLETRTVVTES